MSTCVGLVALAGACNHDGRKLREPAPGQNATISTTAASTSVTLSDAAGNLATDVATTEPALGSVGSAGLAPLVATAPWSNGGPIDAKYSCDGADLAPALSWPQAPQGTVEVSITMTDEQNPEFVHWTLAGLGPDVTHLDEGVVPPGAVQGQNGAGKIGYTGPCPPAGTTHTYLLTVHYMDSQLELGNGAFGGDMLIAIQSASLQTAQVEGTFKRG